MCDADAILSALGGGSATAEDLASRVGSSTQSVARSLSWMRREGLVIFAPLNVARAYARAAGEPSPRAGFWRAR